jgi:hypothetical protein
MEEKAVPGGETPSAGNPPVFCLYLDDSGARALDRLKATANEHPRWFALGGFVVAEADEKRCVADYDAFRAAWPETSGPLHMTDMRANRKNWGWLGKMESGRRESFWSSYHEFICGLPVAALGCVIHRPGYLARGYGSRTGDAKWNLCRTAFNIAVERAAKFAIHKGGRLRVKYEGCNRDADQAFKNYFALLKNDFGLGFNAQTAAKHSPLDPRRLAAALIDLERKDKQSRLMQIADTYVIALARGAYYRDDELYAKMAQAGRLTEQQVPSPMADTLGVKYYCFDGNGPETTKAGVSPGLGSGPHTEDL